MKDDVHLDRCAPSRGVPEQQPHRLPPGEGGHAAGGHRPAQHWVDEVRAHGRAPRGWRAAAQPTAVELHMGSFVAHAASVLLLLPSHSSPPLSCLCPCCSFWGQLALTTVSTVILLFSSGSNAAAAGTGALPVSGALPRTCSRGHCGRRGQLGGRANRSQILLALAPLPPARTPACPSPAQFSFIDVATLVGVLCGYISTFLAWSYTTTGRKLGMLQVRGGAAARGGGEGGGGGGGGRAGGGGGRGCCV